MTEEPWIEVDTGRSRDMEGTRIAEILREHHSVVGGFLGPKSLRCYKGCSGWRSIIRDRVARLEAGEEVVAAAALEGGEK